MEEQAVVIERRKDVDILTIHREKAMNALNREVMNAFNAYFSKAPEEDLKGVVITGAGNKAFAAGADIAEFPSMDRAEGEALARRGHETFNLIEQYSLPVIAAVNGFALGGGCELAMACHLRIASKQAKFGQPEAKLGLIPGYGGTQRLVRYLGHTRAIEYLLTTDLIAAQDALEWGLANRLVENDKVVDSSLELIHKISKKAPLAVEKIIACVNAYEEGGFEQEVEAFGACFETGDVKEGVEAFLEKRSPEFQGK